MEKMTMTAQDWEAVDRSSRTIVSCLLSCIGAESIGESTGCCCWDLSAMLNGSPTSIEIKDRAIPHNKYNDVMVEQVKVDATQRKAQFKRRLAVNVHNDGYVAIANLDDPRAQHKKKYCKYTTLVKGESHDYVEKEIVLLPQKVVLKCILKEQKYVFKRVK